jgi:hypothetical protein
VFCVLLVLSFLSRQLSPGSMNLGGLVSRKKEFVPPLTGSIKSYVPSGTGPLSSSSSSFRETHKKRKELEEDGEEEKADVNGGGGKRAAVAEEVLFF